MRKALLVPVVALTSVVATLLASGAAARDASGGTQQAELIGRAVLPASTFGEAIPSGALVAPANGIVPPFAAQPIQGFSALLPEQDGTYLVLSDNGYGTKANSADFLLRVRRVRADYATGTVSVLPGGFGLSDPDHQVPFPLVRADRRLTGADFDPESFRRLPDGTLWFGEEFGPFLLHTDAHGRLLQPPVPLPGVSSPDDPTRPVTRPATLGSSKGFEGMALSPDGQTLWPMLEGPVAGDDPQTLNVYRYPVRRGSYKGEPFRYRLEYPGDSIGDLTAVDQNRFLVIERDQSQGVDARLKAIYLIDRRDQDHDGYADKQLLVNLLAVPDPQGVGGDGAFFRFPFITIESVAILDPHTLVVANDNNYPGSAGRTPGAPDDDEFIKIRLDTSLTS